MKLAAFFLLLLWAPFLFAEEPPDLLAAARKALGENIPEVAEYKVRRFLAEAPPAHPRETEALLLLGQVLLSEKRLDEAEKAVAALTASGNLEAAALSAAIYAAEGRWPEALALFRKTRSLGVGSQFGEAESLDALGDTTAASAVLEPLVAAGQGGSLARLRLALFQVELRHFSKARGLLAPMGPQTPEMVKWRKHIEARLLLAQGQPAPALILFEEVLAEPAHLPESLRFAAIFGVSEARIALYGYSEARETLEGYIWASPDSPFLERAFARLDELSAHEPNPPEGELHRWSREPQKRRAALSLFYVAKMQVRERNFEKATLSLAAFLQQYPAHALVAEAYLLQADLLEKTADAPGAIRALDAALRLARDAEPRSEAELRAGLIHYRQREWVLAAQLFESAARRSSRHQEAATFNAALSWLRQRNFERYRVQAKMLEENFPSSPLIGELALEEGLVLARDSSPAARPGLEEFLRRFPHSPRQSEARLALAEIAFEEGSRLASVPLLDTAAEYLRVSNQAATDPETALRGQYLAIFIEDRRQPRDEGAVLDLARAFLQEHPSSELAVPVRLKLGQIYFARGNDADAETQFVLLARSPAAGPYAETALFLAGQAAVKLPGGAGRALAFFHEVIELNGPLKLPARQEQAAILLGQAGHEREALTVYESILAAEPPPDEELREAALCGKGEALRALGVSDPPSLEAAVAAFSQLAALKDVSPARRNEALYKKALTLEELGRPSDSLSALYDVLEQNGAHPSRDYYWAYKAGFAAAHRFELASQWPSAIAIYEKLAAQGGPRSAEVAARARDLRLEHFIWK